MSMHVSDLRDSCSFSMYTHLLANVRDESLVVGDDNDAAVPRAERMHEGIQTLVRDMHQHLFFWPKKSEYR